MTIHITRQKICNTKKRYKTIQLFCKVVEQESCFFCLFVSRKTCQLTFERLSRIVAIVTSPAPLLSSCLEYAWPWACIAYAILKRRHLRNEWNSSSNIWSKVTWAFRHFSWQHFTYLFLLLCPLVPCLLCYIISSQYIPVWNRHMFSDIHHRCPHVTEQVSQMTEKVSPVTPVLSPVTPVMSPVTLVLSHVGTCLWHGSSNMWQSYTVIYWRGYFTEDDTW